MIDHIIFSSTAVTVSFAQPRRDQSGRLASYVVGIEAADLSASVRVENPPYGSSPDRFFAELAHNWRGWKGERSWRSMEAELNMVAIADSLGHITITIEIRPDAFHAPWSANASVLVEAGQLQSLSNRFSKFCATEPDESPR